MKKKITYIQSDDFPAENNVRVVKDMLPSPEEMKHASVMVHVTIPVSQHKLDILRKKTGKKSVSYEKLVSFAVDEYLASYA